MISKEVTYVDFNGMERKETFWFNLTHEEMVAMAQEELDNAKAEIEDLDKKLTIALLPKDPNDDKDIYLEIRPAA